MSIPSHATTKTWMRPRERGRRASAGPRSPMLHVGAAAVAGVVIIVTLLLLATFVARPAPTGVRTYPGGAHGRAAMVRAMETPGHVLPGSEVPAPAVAASTQAEFRGTARQANELRIRGMVADGMSGEFSQRRLALRGVHHTARA